MPLFHPFFSAAILLGGWYILSVRAKRPGTLPVEVAERDRPVESPGGAPLLKLTQPHSVSKPVGARVDAAVADEVQKERERHLPHVHDYYKRVNARHRLE